MASSCARLPKFLIRTVCIINHKRWMDIYTLNKNRENILIFLNNFHILFYYLLTCCMGGESVVVF